MYYMYKSVFHSFVLPTTNDHYPNESSIVAHAMHLRQEPSNHPIIDSSIMALGYVGNAAVTNECKDQNHGSRDQSLEGP